MRMLPNGKRVGRSFTGLAWLVAAAVAAPAGAQHAVIEIDIAAQPLAGAINELAEEADVVIVAPAELLAGKQAPAVAGTMTVETALDRLLGPSGLGYTISAGGAIVIARKEQEPSTGPPAPATRPERSSRTADEEIIVTARRRVETVQETPVAMTVLNDALLDRYGVKGIDTIAQLTPGFITAEASGSVGGTIVLRGVGSGDSQPFIDQAVSINVDGVQVSSAQLLRAAQLDLKQIEVLRGPQALFFGKNSPGGIISILSADPGETLELMARTGYEVEADERYVELMASSPLAQSAGARVAVRYSEMDGYIDVDSPPIGPNDPWDLETFPKKKELFLRGTLAAQPTGPLKLRLKGMFTDTEFIGGPSHFTDVVACPYGVPQESPVVAGNCRNDGTIVTALLPAEFLALNPLMGRDRRGFRDNRQMLLAGNADYALGDALTLTSVTGYYDVDEQLASNGAYGLGGVLGFGVDFSLDQFSQELRLASSFQSPFNVLLGGLYERRKLFTATFIGVPAIMFELPVESTNQKHETYSLFGQLLWDVTDRVELTAGGRYSREIKDLLDYVVTPAGGDPVDVAQDPAYPGTRLEFNNFSPEITVAYTHDERAMLFASYKRGFKSGGFDAAYTAGSILANPGRGQTFDPEKVEGVEGGLKSALLERQLIVNLTGYWYDYSDLQVSSFDTIAHAFKTQNAARARVRGVELDGSYRPPAVPGLDLRLAAAYNDARYREYLADCYAGQSQPLGCNQVLNDLTGRFTSQDLSGRRLRKAPVFTATFGGYYEFALASSVTMSLSSDLAYSDGYIVGTNYQPLGEQSSFTKIDASLRVFDRTRGWELALIGRNLTDELNLVNALDRNSTGGGKGGTATCTTLEQTDCDRLADIIGTPALPRTVALQFTYRY